MNLRDIVARIESATGKTARWHGDRAQLCCPAHKDDTASLSVGPGKNGGVVVFCHACGKDATPDILKAAGLEFADLAPPGSAPRHSDRPTPRPAPPATGAASGGRRAAPAKAQPKELVATYDYRDALGELVYQVCRFEPKTFRQRRPDGRGGWTWSLGQTPRVLYRLQDIERSDPSEVVWIVEGEKDADNLAAIGLVSTCNAGGAGKWSTLADDSALDGRRVVIVPDQDKATRHGKDPAGEAHAQDVAQRLAGRAMEVRILRLPPQCKDVSDWLDLPEHESLDPEALRDRIEQMAEQSMVWLPPIVEEDSPTSSARVAAYRSDTGNAARFVLANRARARYCASTNTWYLWNGQRWAPDARLHVFQLAKQVALAIFDEAKRADDDNTRRALAAWALKSQRADRLNAMERLARCELAIGREDLDRDPWLFNCQTGTIDLRTAKVADHQRSDYLTMLAPVQYDPEATCPLWLEFLGRIMDGNEAMIRFIQRTLGMCLTADIGEQYLWIFHGQGANGKGVLLDTITSLMGDYATQAPPDLLMQQPGVAHPTEIADLCGRRLVIASETEEGSKLKVQLVKRLTGDRTLKGRYMRQDYFEFQRTHKLIMATNNRPVVREATHAVWRRLRRVPFDVQIPDEEQDKRLTDKLMVEWPGILNWLIAGCRDWQTDGLGLPDEVAAATKEYEQESDPLLEYIEECCQMGSDLRVSRPTIWDSYQRWAENVGERFSYGRNTFYDRISKRPGVESCTFKIGTKAVRGFNGIGLQEVDNTGDTAEYGQGSMY